jgi:uncharacterized protein YndB with AHSA1/START domain
LAPVIFEHRLGGRVEFRWDEARDALVDLETCDVPAIGEITIWEPKRRVAFTWTEKSTASEVMFELEANGERTNLALTHRRMPKDDAIGFGEGWHASLDALALVIAGRDADPVEAAWRGGPALRAGYAERYETQQSRATE